MYLSGERKAVITFAQFSQPRLSVAAKSDCFDPSFTAPVHVQLNIAPVHLQTNYFDHFPR